jgi:hypothetical protein
MGGSRAIAIEKTRPLLLWDKVLLEVFDLILEQARRIEFKAEPLFPLVSYDINR